jgi:hypothetical protein
VIINNLHFSYDSLTLYDGDSTSSPILGTYCGNTIPPNLISSGNEVLLHLDSDGSVTYSGFQLEHQQFSMSKFDLCTFFEIVECYILLYNSIGF